MSVFKLRSIHAGPREEFPDRDTLRPELRGQRRQSQQVLRRSVEVAGDRSYKFDRLHGIDSSGTE